MNYCKTDGKECNKYNNSVDVLCFVQGNYTPLITASLKNYYEIVKLLMQSKADVNCVCRVS